jgi:hypothetical protein
VRYVLLFEDRAPNVALSPVGSTVCDGVRSVNRRKNGPGDIFIYEERLLDCQAEEGLRGGHVTWTRKWWLSRPCVAGDVELDQVPFSPSLELSQL